MIASATLALFGVDACRAQANDGQDIARIRYDHQHSIGELTRAFGTTTYEERLSSDDSSGTQKKATLRGGVSYTAKDWLRLEAGVGTYYSWREGTDDLFEARLWQAATIDWPEVHARTRWVVHHRFMLEERFQRTDEWQDSLRGRYRLSISVPINRYTVEPGAWYVPIEGEWFWDFGEQQSDHFADRERATVGVGWQLSKFWATELRYVWQESRSGVDGAYSRDDNVIELRVKSTVRILDYLKGR